MSMVKLKIPVLAVIALVALTAAITGIRRPDEGSATLPILEINGIEGNSRSFPEGHGLEIISVFASWCTPCAADMQVFKEISERWKITVTGIAWKDEPQDTAAFIGRFGRPYSWTGVDIAGKKLSTWGVTGMPETLIILDGELIFRHRGRLAQRILQDMIAPIVIDYKTN